MAPQHNKNNTADTAFSMAGGSQNPSTGSNPAQPVNDFTTLYNESMSSPRRVLRMKNSAQPRGYSTMIGRFTTSHVANVASAVLPTSRIRPVRRPRIISGTNSSSGYSFSATPTPISTPATAGLRRAQASIAPAAHAVANASKLVNAWKISTGEAATTAASQMRRPASFAVAQTVAIHASASPNAAMLKNITTSATTGIADTSLVSAV